MYLWRNSMPAMTMHEICLRTNYLYLRDMKTRIDLIKKQQGGIITNSKVKKLEEEVLLLIEQCKEHIEIMDVEREIKNKEENKQKDVDI